jgi:hypothetical protein
MGTRIELCTRSGLRKPSTYSMRSKRSLRLASELRSGMLNLVAERLKTAERDYEEHYGKPKR